MQERIQKILSARGVASRRKGEELLQNGQITVNGQVVGLGAQADPDVDEIHIAGKPLPAENKKIYIMLHKPRGYVTTLSDEKGRPNATQLVADCCQRVYPIGRLDMDSEGLLLFTNDGAFANQMMHPKHEVNKTYEVIVTGFTPENGEKLSQPIELDGYRIRKPYVRFLGTKGTQTKLEITIHEGRNRQIRRMCQAAQMNVLRLKRISEGTLRLGALPLGKWRFLTEDEIRSLMRH